MTDKEKDYMCENCEKAIINYCWAMKVEEIDIASSFAEITVFCSKNCAKSWLEKNVVFDKLKVVKEGLEVIKEAVKW